MTFARRFRLFGLGFLIGLLFLAIFFGPRAFQCSYFPNARALEEASSKPIYFEEEARITYTQQEKLDSAFMISELLKKSKITNFGTDEVNATPCRTYRATYEKEKNYRFVFRVCQDRTIVTEFERN